jgi:hypothetical protein
MRKLLPLLWVMLCALPMSISAQQIFIWEGGISSDWNVGANWTTFGPDFIPNDPTHIAVIIPRLNNPQLNANIQVGTIFTTFAASVNLNAWTLTVGGGDITSSLFSNGRVNHTSVANLNIGGSTFNDIVFEKMGMGMSVQATLFGVVNGDTFTGNARFINSSSGTITIGFEGASTFDGDVILEQNTPLGEIIFGAGGGTSTLTNGSINGTAIHDGTLYLGGIIQQNVGVSSIIGNPMMGYPHTLDIESSEFAGDLVAISLGTLTVMNAKVEGPGNYLEAPEITEIKQSVFVNTAIKKNITALASDVWFGSNKYDNCRVVNESSFDIRLNVTKADTFYNQAAFNNTGSGLLWIAAAGSSHFAGNILINNTSAKGIIVGNNTAGNSATIAGNIKTTGYSNGPLELSRVDQMAVTPNDVFNGTTGLFVRNSRVRGDFSSLVSAGNTRIISSTFDRTNVFSSSNMSEIRQSSFSSEAGTSTTFLKTGNAVNSWYGGNKFGVVNLTNSSNGTLSLANSLPDTLNGKATFRQTGATGNLIPCNSANCLFRDTISTLGTTKKVIFGSGAAGNAIIAGNSAQVLQGDAGLEPEFRRLEMNTTGTLQLDIPLIIVTSTTFTNGIILSSSTNPVIYATTAAPPATGSDASHVDGLIRRAGTGNFRFVTGDNGKYAPVEIAPTGAFGTFEVEYFNASYSSVAVDGSLDHVSTCEYWDISRPGAGDPVDLTMTWDDIRSCGINDLTSLTVAHWNGAMWTNMPVIVIGALPSGTVTVSGVSSFSPFTLASTNAANPLPIELLYFDAQPNGKVVNLHWATATEQNNDYFSIERSGDGLKFDEILRTPGAGNSTERKDYSEVDTRPLSGLSYYRLRQTDFNGESTVSPVVAVRMEGEDKDIKVFPNPADDFFFVETSADPSTLRIRLLNHIGQTVPLAPQVQAGRLAYNVNGLPAGVYYIEVQQDTGTQSRKVIVR